MDMVQSFVDLGIVALAGTTIALVIAIAAAYDRE